MAEKLKVKLLIAVWGGRYVEEFAEVALPSYLAAGNLPVLAAETDFEILVLTTRESRSKFEEHPAFERVRALCPMRYLYIDDLITIGMYGVTLTLAFARGIKDSGAAQTDTHFVFANSDFFLADGSYRSLLARMLAGENCIMAPSLRATAENVLPVLAEETLRGGGILSMAPREMVALTLANLHSTVVGKTVTSEIVSCATHNQIYWQVDSATLLARYHLIFMLAIKPEVPLGPINSYCDYGFVPEMVPSGKFSIMDDSDEFFMLETQALTQERDLVRGGIRTQGEIAAQLTEWTTREHRAFAEVDVIFHTADLPIDIARGKTEFAEYMRQVKSHMGPVKEHAQHIYWALGLQAWLSHIDPLGSKPLPSELGEDAVAVQAGRLRPAVRLSVLRRLQLNSLILNIYVRMLAGAVAMSSRRPLVPIWHHLWTDFLKLKRWTQKAKSDGGRTLFICSEKSLLSAYYAEIPAFQVVFDEQVLTSETPFMADSPFDSLLVHIQRADIRNARAIVDQAAKRLLKPGAKIAVFVEYSHSEVETNNFSNEIAHHLEDILPSGWTGYRIRASFVGGYAKRQLRVFERRMSRFLLSPSLRRLPIVLISLVLWPASALLTAINNIRMRQPSNRCPPYCTSFLLELEALGSTGGKA